MPAFEEHCAERIERMHDLVGVCVPHADLILSPARDSGYTAEELRRANPGKLSELSQDSE